MVRKILAAMAATGMALSPVAANAGAADSLSLSRAGAPMSGASFFQAETDDDDDNTGGGSTAVILGVVLVVLIGIAAISGNSNPVSP